MILTEQSMTLGDMMLRLADRFGVADSADDPEDNRPTLPDDESIRTGILDAINRGVREFYRAHSWTWRSRTMPVPVTASGNDSTHIDGDAAKINLGFGISQGAATGIAFVSGGSRADLQQVFEQEIRELHGTSPRTGTPTKVALCQSEENTRVGMRKRVWLYLWPTPAASGTIHLSARFAPFLLVNPAERLPCPAIHDETVIAFASYALASRGTISSGPSLEVLAAERKVALEESIREDAHMLPQEMGPLTGCSGRAVQDIRATLGVPVVDNS